MTMFSFNPEIAGYFFSLPCQQTGLILDRQKGLFASLDSEFKKCFFSDKYFKRQYNDWFDKKSNLQQSADFVLAHHQNDERTPLEQFYNDFWLSKKDKQQQEADLFKTYQFLVNQTTIIQQLHDCANGLVEKPTPELQQAMYSAWNGRPEFEPKLVARANKPLSTIERLIIAPRTKDLVGGAITLNGIWVGAIQLGLFTVSPFVTGCIALAIVTAFFLLKLVATGIVDRHQAKTSHARQLNEKIMFELSAISNQLTEAIFGIKKTIALQNEAIAKANENINLQNQTHGLVGEIKTDMESVKENIQTAGGALNQLQTGVKALENRLDEARPIINNHHHIHNTIVIDAASLSLPPLVQQAIAGKTGHLALQPPPTITLSQEGQESVEILLDYPPRTRKVSFASVISDDSSNSSNESSPTIGRSPTPEPESDDESFIEIVSSDSESEGTLRPEGSQVPKKSKKVSQKVSRKEFDALVKAQAQLAKLKEMLQLA